MSDNTTNSIVENYKGILQEYCHVRNLRDPSYEVTQFGSPNEPRWGVEVKYGQARHSTPEPLCGSKRFAEQIAAKQVLEILESRQEAFLAGKPLENNSSAAAAFKSEAPSIPVEEADLPPIDAPVELVATALNVASQRLAGSSRRSGKYRESPDSKKDDNEIYARNLAELTVQIVRELITAAESNNVRFTSKS